MTMEDKPEKQQLADIQAQLQRARRTQVRTSAVIAQHKDTLKRLIELTHSPYSSLKTIAASNIKLFIKDFPELEDLAINAVYDLCEDPDQKVRKDGYRAITLVSREQRKWVKRNADVLVQLLQSDEPQEVEVVEQQLNEHLDLDTLATLGVLCDQIVPPDEPLDEDDQATRDRLRGLVLSFLTGRAKRGIIERHANALDGAAESVLVTALLQVIPKLPPADIETVVKELLLPLPSFTPGSRRGIELMDVIQNEAKVSWKAETPKAGERASLPRTRFYLDLANDILQRRLGPAAHYLRFYLTMFISKAVLQSLTDEIQVLVIKHTADALELLLDSASNSDDRTHIITSTVNACGFLFASFVDLKSDLKPWPSCVILLRACKMRLDTGQWKPSANLVPTYQSLHDQASSQEALQLNKEATEKVQSLIRPILQNASGPPPTSLLSPVSSSGPANLGKGMSSNGKPSGGRVQIKRKLETESRQPASTPSRPALQASTSTDAASRGNRPTPPHLGSNRSDRPRTNTAPPGSSSRTTPIAESEPQSKRQKGLSAEGSVPSLLSRLTLVQGASESKPAQRESTASAPSVPAKRRAESQAMPPQNRPSSQRVRPSPPSAEIHPPGGWSIKGAANRRPSPPPTVAEDTPSSLLNRIKRDDQGGGGGSRRKRTKT